MEHHQLELIFAVLFATILAQPLGRRLGQAPAVLMTGFGVVLALIPQVPEIHIDPKLILPLVLPPLLYAAARRTSWRTFAENWGAISLRAVVLVIVTTAAVAWAFHLWYPAVPIGAAVALGALVAPPDPVAVSALAGRLGLPRRLVAVLEGEGLFNDVTAIVLYTAAVTAVVNGKFSAWGAFLDFLVSALVGVLVGVVLGWAGNKLMVWVEFAPCRVALGLLLPFAAYGISESWGGSAVLAVLVCSLYLTEAATDFSDSDYRLIGDSFWEITEMLVTGFAFGLIGLELSTVLRDVGPDWGRFLGGAAVVIAVVVGLRLVWLLCTTAIFQRWWRTREMDEPYTWRETLVTWWAGMRGVATVALALAIPFTTDDGEPFPGRTEILFTAFAVVLFTLLLQGPTLPAVVRATGVHADTGTERAMELQLWTRVLQAELARLKEIAQSEQLPDEIYDRLRTSFERRLAQADPEAADSTARSSTDRTIAFTKKMRGISNEVLEAGRAEALAARREPGIPPDVVDRVMRRLDLRGTG
ncbi:Na+/H+ antiporter [Nocardia seriolae]|uniref:Sodium:proton antiporter n=1 Tax=Nocardia seriolae TaxID=37332 RepID=A0ABC9YUS0_9NOCA|nr:Na+/H+ antiporter [Nocardia seriolae]BEK94773.1 Na+/H+ antiporter [Nocardia seriolae]GAM47193.1 sodium:proton antiporter [Nocardia seriolae]GAP29100.1 sodium:proton antiporter [Nocardia seriolae]